jgi:hypothetical protein
MGMNSSFPLIHRSISLFTTFHLNFGAAAQVDTCLPSRLLQFLFFF